MMSNVVSCRRRLQGCAQAGEVILRAGDLHFGAGEVEIAGNQPEMIDSRGDDGVLHVLGAEQGAIDAVLIDRLEAKGTGRIGLRIEIDEQHTNAAGSQAGCEIHRGGRLRDAALLICHGDDLH
jgi:hypothetical protein